MELAQYKELIEELQILINEGPEMKLKLTHLKDIYEDIGLLYQILSTIKVSSSIIKNSRRISNNSANI